MGAAIRTRNLEKDIDPKTGTLRRIETFAEKMTGDGVPWLMQGGMAALSVAVMASTVPALLLLAVPLSVYFARKTFKQGDAAMKMLIAGNYAEGNNIYRRYNINTQHGLMLFTEKYGAKGATFAVEYQALVKAAGLQDMPNLLMMEPRVRMRNAAAIMRQPARREALNACAMSTSNGKQSAVAMGDVFFNELSPAEVRATIAHELTHIKGRHSRMRFINIVAETTNTIGLAGMTVAAVISGLAILPTLAVAATIYGVSKSASVMQSRYHEKICDRTAAVITGTPRALASAFSSINKLATHMRQERENLRARLEGRAPVQARSKPPLLKRLLAEHPDDAVRIGLLENTHEGHSLSFWRQRTQHLAQAFNEFSARDAAKPAVVMKPTAEQVAFLRYGQGH